MLCRCELPLVLISSLSPPPLHHHHHSVSLLLRRIQSSLQRENKERLREWVDGREDWGVGTGEKKEEEMRQWVTRIQLEETVCQGALRQLIAVTSLRGRVVANPSHPAAPTQISNNKKCMLG